MDGVINQFLNTENFDALKTIVPINYGLAAFEDFQVSFSGYWKFFCHTFLYLTVLSFPPRILAVILLYIPVSDHFL